MWFRKLREAKVLYSKAGRVHHPHIVVGEIGDSYVSMNVTHSPSTEGHPNLRLERNPEVSYLVTDMVFVRPKNQYQRSKSRAAVSRY